MSAPDFERDAKCVGMLIAEGKLLLPYRVWKLPTTHDEHGNLNPHIVRKDA